MRISANECVHFWWSRFAGGVGPGGENIFSYWGDDAGDLRFVWNFLRPGMTFFDIGAYHGNYSVIAGKKLGNTGHVVAFEPCSDSRRRLRLHLRMNGIPLASVEPCAVASANGKSHLFVLVSGFASMNSLRHPPVDNPTTQVEVETVTIDNYLRTNKIDRVDLAKVDTEGGELEVFDGSQRLLTRLRPVIICEVLDWVTQPWGYPARDIISYLSRMDYVWHDFSPDGTLFRHELREQYPEVKNYLAVPREKLAAVQRHIRK